MNNGVKELRVNMDKGASQCKMMTRGGKLIDPFNLRKEDVCIRDIAASLAAQPRFNGHTSHPYSVAQHSVHCAELAPKSLKLQALLHDAAEAYIGDIPRPIKHRMLFRVRGEILDCEDLESEILKTIFDALDVPYSGCYKVLDPVVRIIDDNLLKTESAQLMAKHGGGIFPGVNLPGLVIKPWDWHVAQASFLRAYEGYKGGQV